MISQLPSHASTTSATAAPRTLSLSLLDRVEIASPCHARWEDMTGDDRTRFCSACSLHVHNISDMTRDQAERFVRERFATGETSGTPSARVCGRIFRRPDGTIMTRDCPVGLARVAHQFRRGVMRVGAAMAGLVTAGVALAGIEPVRLRDCEPFRTVSRWIGRGTSSAPTGGVMMLGKMCCPPPIAPVPTPPPATPLTSP